MIVRVSKEEIDIIKMIMSSESQHNGLYPIDIVDIEGEFRVSISEITARLLSDALTLELSRKGFDRDYQLTHEGRLLEDLIDRFNPRSEHSGSRL